LALKLVLKTLNESISIATIAPEITTTPKAITTTPKAITTSTQQTC